MKSNQNEQLLSAIDALEKGAVLAYPTESVWGLGCNPLCKQAFDRLLSAKQRPPEKGVILVAHDFELFVQFVDKLPVQALMHMQHVWRSQQVHKRATTFVVNKSVHAPHWLTGSHDSIAIRVSPHPLVRKLCQAYARPLVSTSCNPAGKPPAMTEAQAQDYFGESVHYLAGSTLGFEKPSQIIDGRTGAILR